MKRGWQLFLATVLLALIGLGGWWLWQARNRPACTGTFAERMGCYRMALPPDEKAPRLCPRSDSIACAYAVGKRFSNQKVETALRICDSFKGLERRWCLAGATRRMSPF